MKKITKYGLSALCGSLAVMSGASAGEMKVVGNAHLTWTSVKGVTGQPLGMKTNLSFVGNGELDGGQTFSVTVAHTDQNAWSSSNITLNTNNLGTFKLSMAEGGAGIGGYDDNMPRAFEERWDAGVGTSINLQKGVGSSTNLSWVTPRIWATTLQLAWAPENDGTQPNDKAVGGASSNFLMNTGYDAVLRINPSFGAFGADLFVGGSTTEQEENQSNQQNRTGNHEEAVAGLILDIGPISIGGQGSAESTKASTQGEVEYYGNTSFGAALNINDNLSISYGEGRAIKSFVNANDDVSNIMMRGESVQVAYTLGGVALKYADTEWENANYTRNGGTTDGKVLSLSMAF